MIGLYTPHHLTTPKCEREVVINALEIAHLLIFAKHGGMCFFYILKKKITLKEGCLEIPMPENK